MAFRNIDYLWSRHVIDSFEKNDVKLFEKAICSTMFDITSIVEGGMFGTPYSIGEYSFFSEHQFLLQRESIMKQRKHALEYHNSHFILTENDMKQIEIEAKAVAYYGTHTFSSVVTGDSILMLGLRKGSLSICKYMLEYAASASFNRKNIVMPEPGPDENALNTSYFILFIKNNNSESYVDVLKSRIVDVMNLLKELEMHITSLEHNVSQRNNNSVNQRSTSIMSRSTASVKTIGGKSAIASSESSVATMNSRQTSVTEGTGFLPQLVNKATQDENDIHISFNNQIEIHKTKKMLKIHLEDLADFIDFIAFLVDMYLPFISQQITLKIDNFSSSANTTKEGSSGVEDKNENPDEETLDYLNIIKELNYEHFMVNIEKCYNIFIPQHRECQELQDDVIVHYNEHFEFMEHIHSDSQAASKAASRSDSVSVSDTSGYSTSLNNSRSF